MKFNIVKPNYIVLFKKSYAILLIFLLLFSFVLPVIKTSSVLAFTLALLYSIIFGGINRLYETLKTYLFVRYIISSIILIVSSILISYTYGTFDYSIANLLVTQVIYIIFTFVVANTVISLAGNSDDLKDYILLICLAFVLQSLIMLTAAFVPSIKSIVQFFQPSNVANVSDRYDGFRGIALASGQFFSLSVSYGLVIIYFCLMVLNKKTNFNNMIIFILIFLGIVFAGRTAFIAIGIVGVIYLINYKRKMIFGLFIIVVLFSFLSWLITQFFPGVRAIIEDNIIRYAFEFIYNYLEYGSLSTSSTDKLDTMYFDINFNTLFFGNGWLYNSDGSYYMSTDAGYMRYVLFGGIWFSILLVLNQLTVFYKYDKMFCVVFVYLLITNYKGMSISLLLITQCILMMLAIFQRFTLLYNERTDYETGKN